MWPKLKSSSIFKAFPRGVIDSRAGRGELPCVAWTAVLIFRTEPWYTLARGPSALELHSRINSTWFVPENVDAVLKGAHQTFYDIYVKTFFLMIFF